MIIRNDKGQFIKGISPWNKGTTGVMKSNTTSFEKGQIPWNKGKKGVMPTPWNKGLKADDNPKVAYAVRKAHEATRGKPSWNKGKECIEKRNEGNSNWKGDDVGYSGLHKWVARHLGQPTVCSHCGGEASGLGMHWANKDHKYERNLEDWIRLCEPCHKVYDKTLICL